MQDQPAVQKYSVTQKESVSSEQTSGDIEQIQTGDLEEIQMEEINLQEQP